jgi:hypothetical protein
LGGIGIRNHGTRPCKNQEGWSKGATQSEIWGIKDQEYQGSETNGIIRKMTTKKHGPGRWPLKLQGGGSAFLYFPPYYFHQLHVNISS